MKKVALLLVALCLLVLSGCGYSADDIEKARQQGYNEGYNIGYDDGFEKGENQGRDNMMEILWDEGEDALSNLWLHFCCPNCKSELRFTLGDGVCVESYPGTRDYPGYSESYYLEIEYQY